jgi:hypothetical protein
MVLLTPMLMREIGTGRGVDWARLSDVGQTYGAASAILSALALGGVAVSLLVQARQAKAQQIQTVRGYQLELLRLTLDNPQLYLPCWGIQTDPFGLDGNRQIVFTNLLMIYQLMGYETGVISESSMRGVILADLFQGEVGRRYWTELGHPRWDRRVSGRQGRRFLRIVDDEYHKAVTAGPPTIPAAPHSSDHQTPTRISSRSDWRTPTAALAGLATGLLLGTAMRSRPRS